jgi:hypothetical protein
MTTSWPDRIIEAGVLFLLVFTPLAFGTVAPWSEAITELVVLGIAVTYVLGTLSHWELRVELPPGWLPALLFLGLVFLRAVPLPGLGSGLLSLDPHATWREGVKLLTVAIFFLVCYNTYRTQAQVRRAVWTLVIMGSTISLFGIVQRASWNRRLYWIGPLAPENAAPFGPYVNRTHFAGLMVIVISVTLAVVLSNKRSAPPHRPAQRWADRLKEWSTEADATRLLPFLVVLMGGAGLVSGSRGGAVALLAAIFAMIAGSVASGASWRGRAARLAIIPLLVVLAGAWISADVLFGTVERLRKELGRPTESIRLHLWTDALTLWRDAPALGTGLATFGVAFPRFRTVQAPVTFTHAESDWVQLLTDTGVVGLGLGLAAGVALGVALLGCYRRAPTQPRQALALAGLVALGGTAVQGIANYNLAVMSNYVYLALTVALAAHPVDILGRRSPETPASTAIDRGRK